MLALGKIGDKRSLETLAALQRTRARRPCSRRSPRRSACSASTARRTRGYLERVAEVRDRDRRLPGSASRVDRAGLARSRSRATRTPLSQLLDVGGPSRDPARAAIALAFGAVALRNTPLMLKVLAGAGPIRSRDRPARRSVRHARRGLEEERFFATVRRGYWEAPEGSPARKIADALIQTLEF